MRTLLAATGVALAAVVGVACSSTRSDHAAPLEHAATNDERPAATRCRAPRIPPAFHLTDAFPGNTFDRPIAVTREGDKVDPSGGAYLVAEQSGKIRRLSTTLSRDSSRPSTTKASWSSMVFLDVGPRLSVSTGEGGLIGLSPSPDFDATGEVFLTYLGGSLPDQITTVIARVQSSRDTHVADPTSLEAVLTLERGTEQGHNGGHLAFGPDRLLYIAVGDGTWETLNQNRAQQTDSLFGKILRIDPLGARPYQSPADNPFAGAGQPEVYAYGFRNPWSFSFDDRGRLWVGDVGYARWEEVNLVEKGANYGWPIREGRHCLRTTPCDTEGKTDPLFEYPHIDGLSISGGYVYRGSAISSLRAKYVFGDFITGRVWSLDPDNPLKTELVIDTGMNITGFAEDYAGELLVIDYSGHIWRLEESTSTETVVAPTLASLDCLSPPSANPATQMATGLIPYEVIAPLWADDLDKKRWFAIPNDAVIRVTDDGAFDLPVGTLLLKELSYNGRRIETRMFTRDQDLGWTGYTFEWSSDQTDAVLLTDGKTLTVDGYGDWTIPSRAQCLGCHTTLMGRVLGFEAAQLDRSRATDAATSAGERLENQLEWMQRVHLLDRPVERVAMKIAPLTDPYRADPAATLEARARSYLHANCSFCHRPYGPGQGEIDLRATVSLDEMHVLCRHPTTSNVETNDVVIAPGDPARSMLTQRMAGLAGPRMPPLGSSRVDVRALDVVSSWVASIPSCTH